MDDLDVRWRQNRVSLADGGFEHNVFFVIVYQ
jgi:hypothetical protein